MGVNANEADGLGRFEQTVRWAMFLALNRTGSQFANVFKVRETRIIEVRLVMNEGGRLLEARLTGLASITASGYTE